ncbi:MAG: anti-sigma factor [Acidobacteriota bacterium]
MTHADAEDIAALDAVGATTPDEAQLLEEHLRSCDSCRSTARELRNAATLMALDLDPVAPPPQARQELLGKIKVKEIARAPVPITRQQDSVVSRWGWLAAAAAIVSLLAWNAITVRRANERAEAQQAAMSDLAVRQRQMQLQNQRLTAQLSTLTSVETRTISLSGQEAAPRASARVFLDAPQRRAFVFFHNLPANPGDKSYQLWIIPAGKSPVSAGVFDSVPSGDASIVVSNLPVNSEIAGLAVTLEPRGGVSAPTGSKFLVGGNL